MTEIEKILKGYEVTSGVEFFMQVPHMVKDIEQYIDERLQDTSDNLDKALKNIEVIIKNQDNIKEQHEQYVVKAIPKERMMTNGEAETITEAFNLGQDKGWNDCIAELKKGLK